MSLVYSIDRTSPALAALNRLAAGVGDRAARNQAAAHSVENLIKEHFAILALANRNKFGARASFWKRMRGTLRSEGNNDGGQVAMGREVALRYFGGTVRARGDGSLTIPVNPAAYGRRAREFAGLQLIKLGKGAKAVAVLAMKTANIHSAYKFLEVFYLLVKSVKVQGHTEVLPAPSAMQAAAVEGASDYTEAFLK